MSCYYPKTNKDQLMFKALVNMVPNDIPSNMAIDYVSTVLSRNNGNAISKNPDGSPSKFVAELGTLMNREAIVHTRLATFSDETIAKVGDWISDGIDLEIQSLKKSRYNTSNQNEVLIYNNGSITDIDIFKTDLVKESDTMMKCVGFARYGLADKINKGGMWKIEKDFHNSPLHSEGGVQIVVTKQGVEFNNGDGFIKAANGVVMGNNKSSNSNTVDSQMQALAYIASRGGGLEGSRYRLVSPKEPTLLTKYSDKLEDSDGLEISVAEIVTENTDPIEINTADDYSNTGEWQTIPEGFFDDAETVESEDVISTSDSNNDITEDNVSEIGSFSPIKKSIFKDENDFSGEGNWKVPPKDIFNENNDITEANASNIESPRPVPKNMFKDENDFSGEGNWEVPPEDIFDEEESSLVIVDSEGNIDVKTINGKWGDVPEDIFNENNDITEENASEIKSSKKPPADIFDEHGPITEENVSDIEPPKPIEETLIETIIVPEPKVIDVELQKKQQELIDAGYDLGPKGADGLDGSFTKKAIKKRNYDLAKEKERLSTQAAIAKDAKRVEQKKRLDNVIKNSGLNKNTITVEQKLTGEYVSTGYINGNPSNGYVLATTNDNEQIVWKSKYHEENIIEKNGEKVINNTKDLKDCSINVGKDACALHVRKQVYEMLSEQMGVKFTEGWARVNLGTSGDAWEYKSRILKAGGSEIKGFENAHPGDILLVSNKKSNYRAAAKKYDKNTPITHVMIVDEVTSKGMWVMHGVGKDKTVREFIPFVKGSKTLKSTLKSNFVIETTMRPKYSKLASLKEASYKTQIASKSSKKSNKKQS